MIGVAGADLSFGERAPLAEAGIESIVAFGGGLLTGQVFVVWLLASAPVPVGAASLFRSLAPAVQSAVTALPGFPTRREIAERYARRSGLDLTDLSWYVGFAYFKFAAIVAGIVARSAAGAMAGKDTSGYAERIDGCVERGRAALDDGAI